MRWSVYTGLLLILLLQGCETRLSTYSAENKKIDASASDHAIDSIALPYRTEMNKQMSAVIGYADSSLLSYAPESPLSNFAADAVFEAGFDYSKLNNICTDQNEIFCLLNFGGLRTSINKGEITLGDIYELMPFDNSLVIVKITNAKVREMVDYLADVKGQPVSNALFYMDSTRRAFQVGPNNHDHHPAFYVITSDYLANGGDKMDFFKDPLDRWDTGILIRDVLITYIKKNSPIPYFPIENRIVIN